MAKSRKNMSRDLMGRDPACGRVAFRTGRIRTMKDKLRDRNSKLSRRHLMEKNIDSD